MESKATYNFRSTAFTKENALTLYADKLLVKNLSTEAERSIEWSQVKEVVLAFANSKNTPDVYLCTLKFQMGTDLVIKSVHYKGLADFEKREEDYALFVRALHEVLAKERHIHFKKGISKGLYILMGLLSIFGIGMYIAISIVMLFSTIIVGILCLIFTPFLGMKLYAYMKKNQPGTYDPKALPDYLLPS